MTGFVKRHKRLHGRVQAKEPIQVEYLVSLDRDGRAHGVVRLLAVRYNQVQSVSGSTLEQDHQLLAADFRGCCLRKHRTLEKGRDNRRTHQGHRAAPHKDSSRDRHRTPLQKETPSGGKSFAECPS